jgi:RNA polymerase sigma-70 factor (ECF subfamily)
MAAGRMARVVQYFRQAEMVRAGLTDGQLLECFVAQREEAAFEALVRRHGPMVLGVCRRVLHHGHDAEDAFQATFLVLLRKAASIVPREQVGPWLYGVAYRTALKAKATAAKRRAKERQVRPVPRREEGDPVWQELLPLLDQELSRLPDKYRVPVILCDLEGKSRKEVARQLGWPEGTLSSRLATARTRLARRLSRHLGRTVSGGTLAALLIEGAAAAEVPGPLVASIVRAATLVAAGKAAAAGAIPAPVAALTEGVLKAMVLCKLKIAAVVLVGLAVLGAGTGWLVDWTPAAEGQGVRNNHKPKEQGGSDERRDSKRGQRDTREEGDDNKDPEAIQKDLEKKLEQVKQEAEKLAKQHAILEIEIAVKKLKQGKDEKAQQDALAKIVQAVKNYEIKILKIKQPDVFDNKR